MAGSRPDLRIIRQPNPNAVVSSDVVERVRLNNFANRIAAWFVDKNLIAPATDHDSLDYDDDEYEMRQRAEARPRPTLRRLSVIDLKAWNGMAANYATLIFRSQARLTREGRVFGPSAERSAYDIHLGQQLAGDADYEGLEQATGFFVEVAKFPVADDPRVTMDPNVRRYMETLFSPAAQLATIHFDEYADKHLAAINVTNAPVMSAADAMSQLTALDRRQSQQIGLDKNGRPIMSEASITRFGAGRKRDGLGPRSLS